MTRAARILATLAVLASGAPAFSQSAPQEAVRLQQAVAAAPEAAARLQYRLEDGRVRQGGTPEQILRLQRAIDAAQTVGEYFAAPNGQDVNPCTPAEPCTAQGAFMRCHTEQPQGDVCNIKLADGDYIDPRINGFYYRTFAYEGNCANPSSVRLIGHTSNSTLFWVQDHAIGIIGCVRFEGHVAGVSAICGRQHVIIDYHNLVFGNMPGGHHLCLTEFTIASCGGTVIIAGDAVVHGGASDSSKINMGQGCQLRMNGLFNIQFFINTAGWSIINAQGLNITGNFFNNGTRCNSDGLAIVRHTIEFPGNTPGNC
jgi:hypothetical protein